MKNLFTIVSLFLSLACFSQNPIITQNSDGSFRVACPTCPVCPTCPPPLIIHDTVYLPAPTVNKSPVAKAGVDITIQLPANSTTLSGSGTDSDGTIAGYSWSRVSGPTTFTFGNQFAASTTLRNLVAGTYTFRLTVTDNKGATGTDDVVVIVKAATTSTGQTLTNIDGWNAYVHLPADYSTSGLTYPTIIFFPGLGEVGTNAASVINNGPGAYIKQGWNGNVIVDGKTIEFIVISLQPPAAYPVESAINKKLQVIKSTMRVDPLRIYLTGLSHGGWCSSTFVTGDPLGGPYTYASQIAAVVEVQGVTPNDNTPYPGLFENFAKAGGKLLGFEQRLDNRGMPDRVNKMNATVPGSGIYVQTNFGTGGHCCWNNFYGGGGVTPSTFLLGGVTQNLYQWLARQSLKGTVTPSPNACNQSRQILKLLKMKFETVEIKDLGKVSGTVPATLHYHEDQQVHLRILDESPTTADASVLINQLQGLCREYLDTIESYKELSNNAYANMNVKAADMWNHKRDGLIKAERDIRTLLAQYSTQSLPEAERHSDLGINNGLSDCPHCGGKEGKDVFLGRLSDVPKFKVVCIPCGVTLIDDRKDKVIANWNRRPESQESKGGEGWISVEDWPLFTKSPEDFWTLTEAGQGEFLAAVPFNDQTRPKETNLWWIKHCVIDDGGLKVVGGDDNEPAGWSLEDVTHYFPIPKPPKIKQP